jgi:hypothetical protein
MTIQRLLSAAKIAAYLNGTFPTKVQLTGHAVEERMVQRQISKPMVLSAIQKARPAMISKIRAADASMGHTGIVFEITFPFNEQFHFDVVVNITRNGTVKVVTVGPKRCPRTNSLRGPI